MLSGHISFPKRCTAVLQVFFTIGEHLKALYSKAFSLSVLCSLFSLLLSLIFIPPGAYIPFVTQMTYPGTLRPKAASQLAIRCSASKSTVTVRRTPVFQIIYYKW